MFEKERLENLVIINICDIDDNDRLVGTYVLQPKVKFVPTMNIQKLLQDIKKLVGEDWDYETLIQTAIKLGYFEETANVVYVEDVYL